MRGTFGIENEMLPSMDDRKRIVRLIDTLLDRNQFSPPRNVLANMLSQLRDRLVEHFRRLESSLVQARTPGADAYVTIHARLLHEFDIREKQFAAGTGNLGEPFVEFLSTWLRLHVLHAFRYGLHPGELEVRVAESANRDEA